MVKANHALSNPAQDAINAAQAVSLKISRQQTRIDILCPNNLRYFVIVLSHCVPSMGFFPFCSLAPLHSSFLSLYALHWVLPFPFLALYIMQLHFVFCLVVCTS